MPPTAAGIDSEEICCCVYVGSTNQILISDSFSMLRLMGFGTSFVLLSAESIRISVIFFCFLKFSNNI